jgi:hypothetical protein
MPRLTVFGLLILSTIAVAQTARPLVVTPSDFITSVIVLSRCFSQKPDGAPSAASMPSDTLDRDVCAVENRSPIALRGAATSAAVKAASTLPDAPSSVWSTSTTTDDAREMSGTGFVLPTLSMERNSNEGWHTLDRKFFLLNALSTVALLADLETTARGLAAQPKAMELNPLFGKHPSTARLYGTGLSINMLLIYQSYHFKKLGPRRNVWTIGPKVSIVVHTAAAINNLIATHP